MKKDQVFSHNDCNSNTVELLVLFFWRRAHWRQGGMWREKKKKWKEKIVGKI